MGTTTLRTLAKSASLMAVIITLISSQRIADGQTTPHLTTAVTAGSGVCPNIPPSQTSFISTNSQVWVDFTYNGGSAGDKYAVEWVEPNGTVYTTDTYSQAG